VTQITKSGETERKLTWLRVQLFTAMQVLGKDDASEFWKMIDDVNACRMPENMTMNVKKQWVPSIPEPYYSSRKHCRCGKKFWRKVSYKAHFALVHILEGKD
jgi:hypothetical protein